MDSEMADAHEQARPRARPRRWTRRRILIAVGGCLLVGLGALMVLTPVDGDDEGRSCGGAPAVAAAVGLDSAAEGDGGWCRSEGRWRLAVGVLFILPGALLLRWGSASSHDASSRGVEYVVSDATRSVIAVVRPVQRRAGQPPRGELPRAGFLNSGAVVVAGPDGTAGLVITKRGFGRECARVLVAPNVLIGMVGAAPTPPLGKFKGTPGAFNDCTCGRRRSKCICGARWGSVQPRSMAEGAWTVVDADLHEVGRITPRPITMDRGLTGVEGTGTMLGRWARSVARWLFGPVVFEVVEADPGLDWRRHGLLMALAALCDRHAARIALPVGGGA